MSEIDPQRLPHLGQRTLKEQRADGAVVEFYVHAGDAGGGSRTWPSPVIMDGAYEQITNALYQVNDLFAQGFTWTPGKRQVAMSLPVQTVL